MIITRYYYFYEITFPILLLFADDSKISTWNSIHPRISGVYTHRDYTFAFWNPCYRFVLVVSTYTALSGSQLDSSSPHGRCWRDTCNFPRCRVLCPAAPSFGCSWWYRPNSFASARRPIIDGLTRLTRGLRFQYDSFFCHISSIIRNANDK